MSIIVPIDYDEEMIDNLLRYGNVVRIEGRRVKLIKTAPGIHNHKRNRYIGDPRGIYLTIEMWMQHMVEDIEAEKRARGERI